MLQNQMGFFFLIFIRISGFTVVAPIFSSKNVPAYIKIGFSLAIAYILYPFFYNSDVRIPESLFPYILILFEEFVVGLVIGFVSSMIFYAVQSAGNILDMQIGFGIVNIFDPLSGQQLPLVGNFKYILALIVFLSMNGHHVLLTALVDSFKLVPVMGVVFHTELVGILVDMVVGIFIIAIKICMPVLVALLLTDMALGVLARTMPQMNIFIVGVPGKIIVGIFVLSLALPAYIAFLEVAFNGMYSNIYHLMANLK
jgi:flagellar biosynthetic protein FliR